MAEDIDTAPQASNGQEMLWQPGRLALLALVVLGAFEAGRLVAGALIGPWLAQTLLGTRTPVVVGEFDVPRLGVEVLAIAVGVCLAALVAIPLVKVLARR